MSQTALVVCPSCLGTGNATDAVSACDVCLGQRHIAVDRMPDGTVPAGMTEWAAPLLPETPTNPLVLTYPAYQRCVS